MTTASAPLQADPTPAPFLRRIWERMAAVYPNKWRAAMGESPQDAAGTLTLYGDTWAKGLAGLQPQQLAQGLEACITRADAWPPTLPEFRALCLGIPSLLEVREDLKREGAKRAPFTVLVGRRLSSWDYAQADARTGDRMLREAYDDAREAVMRGEPLPERLEEVAHDPEPYMPAPPERARELLAEARAKLGLEPRA